ncbi:MAG: autotransporter domain-containing protein, partial [Verrucomicrobiota bacterium]
MAAWNALPDVIGADINAGATATQSIAAAQINSGDLFSVDVSGNVAGSQSVTYVFQVGGAAVTGFPVNQPVSGMFSLGTISFVNSVDVVASVAFQITGINSADVFTVDLTNFAASSTPPTVTVVDVGPLQTFSNTGGSHSAFTTANFTTFLGLVGQFRSRAPSYRRSSPEPVGKKVVVIDPKNPMFFSDPELDRWEVFAQGGYGFQDQDQISLDPGYSGDLAAGTVGFSRIVSQNWRLGLGYSFAENDIEVGDIGAADVQGHALHAFSSWTRGGWFAD